MNPTNKFHLIVQSNSPGEISAWVIPLLKSFRRSIKHIYITVILQTCAYATTREKDILNDSNLVDHIIEPKQSLLYFLGIKKVPNSCKKGAVLFLGGEPFYTQILGFRLGFPIYGYHEKLTKLGFFYQHVFSKDVDGDLMQLRVNQFKPNKQDFLKKHQLEDYPYTLFMPGSRVQHFNAFFPLLISAIQLVMKKNKNFYPLICLSPFLTTKQIKLVLSQYDLKNIKIIQESSLDCMSIARSMISIPGTNTAEAFYMKLPILTVLPLNKPDVIIFDGILNVLFSFPMIGGCLKKIVLNILKKRNPLISLPNQIAKQIICPQIIKNLKKEELAHYINDFVTDKKSHEQIVKKYEDYIKKTTIDQMMIKKIFEKR